MPTIQLIEGASQWHRLWSIRWAIIGAALNAAGVAWTAFNGAIPTVTWASVNCSLMVAIAISRVISQDLPPPNPPGQ